MSIRQKELHMIKVTCWFFVTSLFDFWVVNLWALDAGFCDATPTSTPSIGNLL